MAKKKKGEKPEKKDLKVKDVLEIKKQADKIEKKLKDLTKTYKGDLVFRRLNDFGRLLAFDVDVDGLYIGKKIVFKGFLPPDFDITEHEITGSVTYKIDVKKK